MRCRSSIESLKTPAIKCKRSELALPSEQSRGNRNTDSDWLELQSSRLTHRWNASSICCWRSCYWMLSSGLQLKLRTEKMSMNWAAAAGSRHLCGPRSAFRAGGLAELQMRCLRRSYCSPGNYASVYPETVPRHGEVSGTNAATTTAEILPEEKVTEDG